MILVSGSEILQIWVMTKILVFGSILFGKGNLVDLDSVCFDEYFPFSKG